MFVSTTSRRQATLPGVTTLFYYMGIPSLSLQTNASSEVKLLTVVDLLHLPCSHDPMTHHHTPRNRSATGPNLHMAPENTPHHDLEEVICVSSQHLQAQRTLVLVFTGSSPSTTRSNRRRGVKSTRARDPDFTFADVGSNVKSITSTN